MKRVFQLAEDRGQLDRHRLRRLKPSKAPKRKIRVFTESERHSLCRAARQREENGSPAKWEVLIRMGLGTGMRRGELMNATWRDGDFANMTIDVSPKKDSQSTWEWHIKDTERRTLPLTADLLKRLIEQQMSQPEGNPYISVPMARYERIQELRRARQWSVEKGRSPLSKFCHHLNKIRRLAGIETGTFHDLRRTCLTNWVTQGLSLHEVKELAGHAGIETTERFYLAVRTDVVDRARGITQGSICCAFVGRPLGIGRDRETAVRDRSANSALESKVPTKDAGGDSTTSTAAPIVSLCQHMINNGPTRSYEIKRRSAEGQATVRRTSLACA